MQTIAFASTETSQPDNPNGEQMNRNRFISIPIYQFIIILIYIPQRNETHDEEKRPNDLTRIRLLCGRRVRSARLRYANDAQLTKQTKMQRGRMGRRCTGHRV